MSQAKVDKYKQDKANRKEIMKKQKRMHRLEMTAIAVVCAVLVGWIGFSVYEKAASGAFTPQTVVEFDNTAVDTYMDGLAQE